MKPTDVVQISVHWFFMRSVAANLISINIWLVFLSSFSWYRVRRDALNSSALAPPPPPKQCRGVVVGSPVPTRRELIDTNRYWQDKNYGDDDPPISKEHSSITHLNKFEVQPHAGYTHFPWIGLLYKLRGELLALSAQISLLVLAPNITCTRSWLPGAHYWGPKKINTVSPTTIASSTPPLAKPVQLLNTTTETKGQLISKCPFGVFKSSKKTTKFFPGFLP